MRNLIENASRRVRQAKLLTPELRDYVDTPNDPDPRQVFITMKPNKWYFVERAINRTPRLSELLKEKQQSEGIEYNDQILGGKQVALVASPTLIVELTSRWDIQSIIPDPPRDMLVGSMITGIYEP